MTNVHPNIRRQKPMFLLSSSMYRTYKFRGCWPCWLEKPLVPPAIFVLCSLYQNV
ncbi:hypothetical protein BDA96_01G318400 [Sorghum bicolor]|uniref:Uncharacterized protein n=1 Tax=Sorghum bicolor TaxID=4558 RepID=A0A921UZ95_SORBI|nr:hypothetical protein BDA96_01G318400 [Sorghum bicolor]